MKDQGIHFEDYRVLANEARERSEMDGPGVVKLTEMFSIDGDLVASLRIIGSNEADLSLNEARVLRDQLGALIAKREK